MDGTDAFPKLEVLEAAPKPRRPDWLAEGVRQWRGPGQRQAWYFYEPDPPLALLRS